MPVQDEIAMQTRLRLRDFNGDDMRSLAERGVMLSEEPTQYLFLFRTFLFNQRTKIQDPLIQAVIEQIDQELSRRRKLSAGPVR